MARTVSQFQTPGPYGKETKDTLRKNKKTRAGNDMDPAGFEPAASTLRT